VIVGEYGNSFRDISMKAIIEELLEAACVKGLSAGSHPYPVEGSLCPACPILNCPAPAPCPTFSNLTTPAKSNKKTTLEIESAKCGNMVRFQVFFLQILNIPLLNLY